MYSFKEKSRILKELLNPAFGESDLSLLRRLSPEDSLIATAQVSPSRNAEAVLFRLLDLTTREEIRLNRRNLEQNSTKAENGGDSVVEVTETSGEQRTSPKAGKKKSSRKSKSTRISGGKGSVKTKTSK
ncbi:collagen-binding surface protein [Tannerella sp. CAG:51]|nr:collagen-binding surface protein [Tannerella sp. CAG:51]